MARRGATGQSSTTSGYMSGGFNGGSYFNVIEKFSFSVDGNATDVGDLTRLADYPSGQSSTTSGYTSGGRPGPVNIIDKFPFSTDANATDVGDLTRARRSAAGQSSSLSGYSSGGYQITPVAQQVNIIDKFPFASNANATDVGDLTQGRYNVAGQSSTTSGYTSGGISGVFDTIDKFPFSTDSNATDVGNLTVARSEAAGQQV